MKTIAYINWVFFLFVFLFFAYTGIEGLNKSFNNNYFEEQQLKNDKEHFYSNSGKLLVRFPKNPENPIITNNFPFHLFTHIILGENMAASKFDTVHYSLLKNKDNLINQLEDTDLLLNINRKNLNFPTKLLEEGCKILDSLQFHFPNTNQGLVFEINIANSVNVINDSLEVLTQKLSNLLYTENGNRKKYKTYICFKYLNNEKLDKIDTINNKNLLPNYSGQFIKTFELQEVENISHFDRMDSLLNQVATRQLDNTIFCFPTYSSLDSSVIISSAIDKVQKLDYKFTEYEYREITKNDSTTKDTLLYFKKDSTLSIFENQKSLKSKLAYAKNKDINIGFWQTNTIYAGKLTQEIKMTNPIADLLKFAKGNFFKKAVKKPAMLKDIVVQSFPLKQELQTDWRNQGDWFWQTVDNHKRKDEKPDYLLFLLIPLFVLRIFLPVFTSLMHGLFHSWTGDRFLKPLWINLFKIPIPAYKYLALEILFWLSLLTLFLFHWTNSQDYSYTTRNFSILLLLIAVLGRPIVKFIIKLVKLSEKSLSSFFKKAIKLLPYLGEVVYYSFAQEEKEKSIAYIKRTDKEQDVYQDSRFIPINNSEGTEDDAEFKRAEDFFTYRAYRKNTNQEQDNNLATDAKGRNHKGQGRIDAKNKTRIEIFRLLFVISSMLILYLGLEWHLDLFNSIDSLEVVGVEYFLVFLIFFIELAVVYRYFKEYSADYIRKLFASHD